MHRRCQKQQQANARPPIKQALKGIEDYDTIYIVFLTGGESSDGDVYTAGRAGFYRKNSQTLCNS